MNKKWVWGYLAFFSLIVTIILAVLQWADVLDGTPRTGETTEPVAEESP